MINAVDADLAILTMLHGVGHFNVALLAKQYAPPVYRLVFGSIIIAIGGGLVGLIHLVVVLLVGVIVILGERLRPLPLLQIRIFATEVFQIVFVCLARYRLLSLLILVLELHSRAFVDIILLIVVLVQGDHRLPVVLYSAFNFTFTVNRRGGRRRRFLHF